MNLNIARRLLSNRGALSNALLHLGFARNYIRNHQPDPKWNRVLKESEDVFGGFSFRNVEVLVNDEILQLMSTNHSLLDISRDLTVNKEIPYGLVILLFAKAGQRKRLQSENQLCPVKGVLHSQYIISKVARLMKLTIKIHKKIQNVGNLSRDDNIANGKFLLSGDYALSECLREIAKIPDHFVLEYMFSAFRDLALSQHLGITDKQNRSVPSKPRRTDTNTSYIDEFSCDPIFFPNALGDAKAEWLLRTILGGGSLLAKSCLSCLRLANYPEYTQAIGFSFGKNFALGYQAYRDLGEFLNENKGSFSLVSAPFLFQLQNDPELYEKIEDVEYIDFDFLRGAVVNGVGILKTMMLQEECLKSAVNALDIMGESKAQAALKNLISLMGNSF